MCFLYGNNSLANSMLFITGGAGEANFVSIVKLFILLELQVVLTEFVTLLCFILQEEQARRDQARDRLVDVRRGSVVARDFPQSSQEGLLAQVVAGIAGHNRALEPLLEGFVDGDEEVKIKN